MALSGAEYILPDARPGISWLRDKNYANESLACIIIRRVSLCSRRLVDLGSTIEITRPGNEALLESKNDRTSFQLRDPTRDIELADTGLKRKIIWNQSLVKVSRTRVNETPHLPLVDIDFSKDGGFDGKDCSASPAEDQRSYQFVCKLCNRRYCREKHLERHRASVHPMDPSFVSPGKRGYDVDNDKLVGALHERNGSKLDYERNLRLESGERSYTEEEYSADAKNVYPQQPMPLLPRSPYREKLHDSQGHSLPAMDTSNTSNPRWDRRAIARRAMVNRPGRQDLDDSTALSTAPTQLHDFEYAAASEQHTMSGA